MDVEPVTNDTTAMNVEPATRFWNMEHWRQWCGNTEYPKFNIKKKILTCWSLWHYADDNDVETQRDAAEVMRLGYGPLGGITEWRRSTRFCKKKKVVLPYKKPYHSIPWRKCVWVLWKILKVSSGGPNKFNFNCMGLTHCVPFKPTLLWSKYIMSCNKQFFIRTSGLIKTCRIFVTCFQYIN